MDTPLNKQTITAINQQLTPDPMSSWKHKLQQKINCNKDDKNCWKTLLPSLPCNLSDTKCWKNKYPDIPCSSNDQECWKKLLPELPCALHDEQCWKKYNLTRLEKFSPKLVLTAQNIADRMNTDTEAIWL